MPDPRGTSIYITFNIHYVVQNGCIMIIHTNIYILDDIRCVYTKLFVAYIFNSKKYLWTNQSGHSK